MGGLSAILMAISVKCVSVVDVTVASTYVYAVEHFTSSLPFPVDMCDVVYNY